MLANRSTWRIPLMKSWISKITIAIAMLIALPVLAHADNWALDPAHTNVEFTVRHMMISNVKGQFQKSSGTVTINGNDPTSAKIDATIDATSIDTRVDKRDDHLQIDQGRSGRPPQVESDGRPDAAWRDQAGGARSRKYWNADHRPDGQHARGRVGDDENQPQRLRPDLESAARNRRRDGG